jgi:uncharacterized lipoprotein YehR (DUF1307 family)
MQTVSWDQTGRTAMSKHFRRALTLIFLSSIALAFTGCGKKLVGNTFKSGNGQLSISFSSETKADVKNKGQEIDDVDWSQTGDTITAKTKVFGDMVFKVQSDGSLKYGEIPLVLKE